MTFEAKRLGDVAEIIGGGTPSTKDAGNWDGDIPWLTPKDLSTFEGIYIDRGSRSITEQGFKTSSAKMLPVGAVLYTSRAPIGYVAIASNPISTNQGFKSLILKDGYVPEFVFYLLKASKSEIESHASGGTFAEISAKALSDVVLRFPPKVQQQAISKLLKSLDEKIAANNAISKRLEDIAQTIFKSWFIDFDPVKAKMAGEKPEGMDAATAALFPDSMVESELGMIPKGWEISSVGEFCPFKYGKALPASVRLSGAISVYGSNGVVGKHNEALTTAPSIVIGRKGTVGTVNLELSPCWVIDTAFYASTADSMDIYLAYLQLKTLGLTEMNSDGAVPGLNRDNAHRNTLAIGTSKLRNTFAEIAQNIFLKIAYFQAENRSLIGIRDSLLPRLISGELQIPEEMLAS